MDELLHKYIADIRHDFEARVKSWVLVLEEEETFLVTAGMLCRQLTICISVVQDPQLWNPDLGLMILRLMSGLHIDLAWIALEPTKRSRMYIDYGTGQGLLDLEHKRIFAKQQMVSKESLHAAEVWLSRQRREMFTEVNLASWSGLTVSKMAEEANALDVYEGFYVQNSLALHSSWSHLATRYLEPVNAENETKWFPIFPEYKIDPSILFLSARLMDKTLQITDKIYPSKFEKKTSAYESLRAAWKKEREKKMQ